MPSFTTCPHCQIAFRDTAFDTLAAELAEAHQRIRELESAPTDGSRWVDVEGALEHVPEDAS